MKSKIFHAIVAGTIIALYFILCCGITFAQETDKNLHGIKFICNSRPSMGTGINKEYVSVKYLAKYFDVEITPQDGGRSIKVENLFYNKDLIVYKGETYAKVSTFMNFFDVGFVQVNLWTYEIKNSTIPMFDSVFHKVAPSGKVKIGETEAPIEVIMIKDRKYVPLEDLARMTNASVDTSGDHKGILKVNGKVVDHWIRRGGKIYVWTEDMSEPLRKKVS